MFIVLRLRYWGIKLVMILLVPLHRKLSVQQLPDREFGMPVGLDFLSSSC